MERHGGGRLPGTSAALAALEKEVDEELPRWRPPAWRPAGAKRLRHLENQVAYAQRAAKKLSGQLRELRDGKRKTPTHRMTPPFLCKVALSKPTSSARAFAATWVDLVGTGDSGCSRTTITRARDAFAEVVKDLSKQEVLCAAATSAKHYTAQARSTTAPSASKFLCAALLHVHDEASLRLRSSLDTDGAGPSRSRSSKVQQHCLWLQLDTNARLRVPAELDALANKTAATIATSLHRQLRRCAEDVGAGFAKHGASALAKPWFVHVLVADSVSANLAAAKLLIAWVDRDPLPCSLQYFLIAVKCSSHQTNLTVASTVSRRAALCGAQNAASLCEGGRPLSNRDRLDSKNSPHGDVCGAVVRLFKFLVSDYYEDFLANLRALTRRRFSATAAATERERELWQRKAQLYGDSVFPPGLLDLLNGGVACWGHHLAPGEGETELLTAQEALLQLLRRRILVVDEHPTLTRMWTFTSHVDGLLLLHFLNCSEELLTLRRRARLQPRSAKRLTSVCNFMQNSGTPQFLRRTSLALQLCTHVLNLCGTLADGHEGAKPLLVRLAQDEVSTIVKVDLSRLLCSLHWDPDLDKGACVAHLLATAMDLTVRFRQYTDFPTVSASCAVSTTQSTFPPAWTFCTRAPGPWTSGSVCA